MSGDLPFATELVPSTLKGPEKKDSIHPNIVKVV